MNRNLPVQAIGSWLTINK